MIESIQKPHVFIDNRLLPSFSDFCQLSAVSLVLILKFNVLHLSASRAQQVPAVSQSAYSPSSSDTGESMLANSPQTVLTKSLPPANIMGMPPTQPTTKVLTNKQYR